MEPVEKLTNKFKTTSVSSDPHNLGYQQGPHLGSNPNLSNTSNQPEMPYHIQRRMYTDLNNESPRLIRVRSLPHRLNQQPLNPNQYLLMTNQFFNQSTQSSGSPWDQQNAIRIRRRKDIRRQFRQHNLPNTNRKAPSGPYVAKNIDSDDSTKSCPSGPYKYLLGTKTDSKPQNFSDAENDSSDSDFAKFQKKHNINYTNYYNESDHSDNVDNDTCHEARPHDEDRHSGASGNNEELLPCKTYDDSDDNAPPRNQNKKKAMDLYREMLTKESCSEGIDTSLFPYYKNLYEKQKEEKKILDVSSSEASYKSPVIAASASYEELNNAIHELHNKLTNVFKCSSNYRIAKFANSVQDVPANNLRGQQQKQCQQSDKNQQKFNEFNKSNYRVKNRNRRDENRDSPIQQTKHEKPEDNSGQGKHNKVPSKQNTKFGDQNNCDIGLHPPVKVQSSHHNPNNFSPNQYPHNISPNQHANNLQLDTKAKSLNSKISMPHKNTTLHITTQEHKKLAQPNIKTSLNTQQQRRKKLPQRNIKTPPNPQQQHKKLSQPNLKTKSNTTREHIKLTQPNILNTKLNTTRENKRLAQPNKKTSPNTTRQINAQHKNPNVQPKNKCKNSTEQHQLYIKTQIKITQEEVISTQSNVKTAPNSKKKRNNSSQHKNVKAQSGNGKTT